MNIIRATHQLATEMSALARYSLAKGFKENALDYYKQAYRWERKAAFMTTSTDEDKDAHFILLRSAAALAYKAQLYSESEKLIEICRSENPPVFILEELDTLNKLLQIAQKTTISTKEIHINLEGILTKINTDENEITLKNSLQAKNFSVIVPRHLLLEIARQFLLNNVKVEARQTATGIFILENISAAA